MPTIDSAVEAYVKLRDEKDAIKKRHSAELKPLNDKMFKLENWLLTQLQAQNANSMNTPHGTCYQSKRTSSKVQDWDEILTFIRENDLWHVLERRVSKSAIEEYVEAHGELPPGVSLTTEIVCNIRRSS